MGQVNLQINGRSFGMECDDGQEQRVKELGEYVENKVQNISSAGAANNETHLLVLTALMLADEVIDLRDDLAALGDHVESKGNYDQEQQMVAEAIDTIAERIEIMAERVQKAA